jgi:pimeloyl-ACP methyl ester carboxylesterase
LVVCHGWGANRSDILERTFFLNTEGGHNLFYFDFRNHGDSGSGLSSLSQLEMGDLEAALDHVRAHHPTEARRVALYGMSLGAAICLLVAARQPRVAGVVAESPFGNYNEVVARFGRLYHHVPSRWAFLTLWAVRWRLGFDPQVHSPLRVIHQIAPRPVFIIQGDADVRMPPSEGRRLFAAAGEPKTLWTLPNAHHGEMAELGGTEYRRRVLEFYRNLFPGASA